MKQIILASQSPRRKELLEMIGVRPEVIPPLYDEVMPKSGDPVLITTTFAREKAQSVPDHGQAAIIIAADTIVSVDNVVYGKPKSRDEAVKMLEKMSGRIHQVVTGYALLDTERQELVTGHVITDVLMRSYGAKEIETHLNTTEYLDKAGAYAVQDRGAILIERIEGDFYNIVGLPISSIYQELHKVGITI
ncbi:MAG: Maf family protein [Patescibacteria group bacterium]